MIGLTKRLPKLSTAAVAEARRLRRQCPVTGTRQPWSVVAELLARAGYYDAKTHKPFAVTAILQALRRSRSANMVNRNGPSTT